jgi:hypothetical protein
MQTKKMLGYLLAGVLVAVVPAGAQEKQKPPEEHRATTTLKIQVVFTEFDGDKKVGSLPNTIFLEEGMRGNASLRMGLRVPVIVPTKDAPNSIQYIDIGTEVDCNVHRSEADDRFVVALTVHRSSLYSTAGDKQSSDWKPGDPLRPLDWKPGDAPLSSQPIISEFRSSSSLTMKDGQTIQMTLAADPMSGRIRKVDVTLTVVK